MSALTATRGTLLDLANRSDPSGKISKMVEILNQTNEILDDMSWVEGNLPTGHKTTVRTGLPSATWRALYKGVQPSKSTSIQVTDTTGMLEAYAEVDKKLADLNGNSAEWRMSEERAFYEAMNQEMASTIFYGNEKTNYLKFTGLAPRYNSTSAENAVNIVDGGAASGQTDCASIWLVVWGENTCHGIVPKGSQAGLQMEDKGQVTLTDTDGGLFEGYRSHYSWDAGLTVRDWRYVVRIANIDRSALSETWTSGAFSAGPDLSSLMVEALEIIPNLSMGRPVFYMDRKIRTKLRKQMTAKSQNSTLTVENIAGKLVTSFDGIPVRRVDALAGDEGRVA